MHLCMVSFLFINQSFAQSNEGSLNGNFQIGGQFYVDDDANEAQVPEQLIGFNSFANIIYTKGKFTSGIRFESYEPSLLGYPASPLTPYEGSGIGYRYATYNDDDISFTVGNFYEQFGSGLIYRTYEERNLGVDNAMDGIRVVYRPTRGVQLKGVYGKQRLGFTNGFTKGPGIVRGFDSEFQLNDILDSIYQSKTRVTLGGSFVSKFQSDLDADLILPQNVGSFAGRMNINRGLVNFYTEYAYKMADPSDDNGFIYKDGQAFLMNTTISKRGLGITLGAQYVDNMSFRTDRNAGFTDVLINYVPAVPRQHTYNLPATLYPYATQFNGEVGFTGEIMYKLDKDTPLGGKYGTIVSLNGSFVSGLDTTNIDDLGKYDNRKGYETNIFSLKGETYFRDIHLEINKKISKKLKTNFMLINFVYNYSLLQKGQLGGEPNVGTLIEVADITYKINKKHALRIEAQAMQVGNFLMNDFDGDFKTFDIDKEIDQGHWLTGIMEYTYSPHWFVAIQDQHRLGNSHYKALSYPLMSFGYTKNATRFMVTGGRQRAGLFCVGGVCRQVPASTGVSLTITSSF